MRHIHMSVCYNILCRLPGDLAGNGCVCIYIQMCINIYIYIYTCMCICICTCICICIYVPIRAPFESIPSWGLELTGLGIFEASWGSYFPSPVNSKRR